MCPMKQKEQTVKISYQQYFGVAIDKAENMWMEETWFFSLKRALEREGVNSKFPHDWEIFKLFFIVHNVSPLWVRTTFTAENMAKVNKTKRLASLPLQKSFEIL